MHLQICFARLQATLWVVWLLCVSAPAWSLDHIAQRGYWQDASGQMAWPEVQGQSFTPFTGVLSRGFTPAAVWVKLRITPPKPSPANDKLILRIRPVYLDEISLFDPLDTSGQSRVVGDRTNYSDEEYKSLTYTFVIPAADAPRDVWLRLKTTSTSMLNIEALSPDDMMDAEYRMLMAYGLVLALIGFFTLFVFIHWLNQPERLYGVFVVRHVVYFIYAASFFGFHRFFLDGVIDAKHLDWGYNWLAVGATGFSIWYEKQFLLEYAPAPAARWSINALLAWWVVAGVLLASGHILWALKANMLLNAASPLVLLGVASVFVRKSGQDPRRQAALLDKKIVVTYYAAISALLVFSVMPYLGLISGNELMINGLPFYAVVSGLMVTVLMQLRARQLRAAHAQYAQDLLLSQQQTQLEKLRREEQSQMLTMLMHELKNPLAVIDLAQQGSTDEATKGYVARNVGIIKNILDRCLSADQMALGQLNVHRQAVRLDDLLSDVVDQQGTAAARIQVHNPFGKATVQTDYQCVQIIINNLLDNALRYGDMAQPVTVVAQAQTNPEGVPGVALSVANKPGLASWPDPDRVFQKYYRSSGAQSISGTGLGLFLVASLAQMLAGTCRYAPDDTHVRFELWLPT
jgi:signal transduction histidine kinase